MPSVRELEVGEAVQNYAVGSELGVGERTGSFPQKKEYVYLYIYICICLVNNIYIYNAHIH